MVVMFLLWSLISFPLTLFGTVIGRNWAGVTDNPCRVKRIPSPIPFKKRYLQPWAIVVAGGLLPFGSIFIEMYFIFTSFWAYKIYYVYGFMLLGKILTLESDFSTNHIFAVFLILLTVTVCVTIVCTYFLLNAEDYR